jgi:hypothetical protein
MTMRNILLPGLKCETGGTHFIVIPSPGLKCETGSTHFILKTAVG